MTTAVLCLVLMTGMVPSTGWDSIHGWFVPQRSIHDTLDTLLRNLYSKDSKELLETKKGLIALARKSRVARQEVVNRLIGVLDDTLTITEKSLYSTWYAASSVLGALKATEAIDVLIRYLDFSNGVTGFSISHRPAAEALVHIGYAAVPKLAEALFSKDNLTRSHAAEVLGHIGGTEARRALRRAIETETDSNVIEDLKRALSAIAHRDKRVSKERYMHFSRIRLSQNTSVTIL